MSRAKSKVLQITIERALRAARDADLDVRSFTVSEDTGEVRIFTNFPDPSVEAGSEIDAAVRAYK